MEYFIKFKSNQKRVIVHLTLSMGLAFVFIGALLWVLGGTVSVHADPTTLYVDVATGSNTANNCTDKATPCATIGYALTQAENGDEIHVVEGTYLETLDIGISVTLKGGYTISDTIWLPRTGETVVDANGANDSVIWIGPETNVTVDGFTIQGANNLQEDGGGFFIDDASVVISDTVIQNNSALSGGGILVERYDEFPGSLLLINSSLLTNTASEGGGGLKSYGTVPIIVENVEIRGNTVQGSGGGGGLNTMGTIGLLIVTNSRIVNNSAQGGSGGGLIADRLVVTNSQIVNNYAGGGRGGGVFARDLSAYDSDISDNEINGDGVVFGGGVSASERLFLIGSTVRNNLAVGTDESMAGGIDAENAEVMIADSLISGNMAQFNAGLSLYHSVFTITNSFVVRNVGVGLSGNPTTGTLMNVTVADNIGDGVGGDLGGDVSITNSIMWGNENDYVCAVGCTLSYSNVGSGDLTGTGNISSDPLFVDAANGDYHLLPESPSINTGVNAGAPDNDFEGDPRPFEYIVDMGADEWWPFLAVALDPGQIGEGLPGTDVRYTLAVTNSGSYTDTIELTASSTWTSTLSAVTSDPLGTGEAFTFTLTVSIPPDAVVGTLNIATITATSGWSEMVSDTVQITTTARPYNTFLPAILN